MAVATRTETPKQIEKRLRIALEMEHEAKEALEEAKEHRKAAREWFLENDHKSMEIETEYGLKKVTLIRPDNKRWNSDKLKVLLKKSYPKSWKKKWQAVTTRVLDAEKLSAAVAEGAISEEKITEAYEVESGTSYLRATDA